MKKQSGYANNGEPASFAQADEATSEAAARVKAAKAKLGKGKANGVDLEADDARQVSLYKAAFQSAVRPLADDDIVPKAGRIEPSGFSRECNVIAPMDAARVQLGGDGTVTKTSKMKLPGAAVGVKKKPMADPVSAENGGKGPTPWSTSYSAGFNGLENTGPGVLLAEALKDVPDGNFSVGYKEPTGFTMNGLSRDLGKSVGGDEVNGADLTLGKVKGAKVTKDDLADTRKSVYQSSFKKGKGLDDDAEPVPRVNFRDNSSGFMKGNSAAVGGVPGSDNIIDDAATDLHHSTLARMKYRDPVEYQNFLHKDEPYKSTYQINFERSRAAQMAAAGGAGGGQAGLNGTDGAGGLNGTGAGAGLGGTGAGGRPMTDEEKAAAKAAYLANKKTIVQVGLVNTMGVRIGGADDGSQWKTIAKSSFLNPDADFEHPDYDVKTRKVEASAFTKANVTKTQLQPADDPDGDAARATMNPTMRRLTEKTEPQDPFKDHTHKTRRL